MAVEKGNKVSVEYVGTFEDGTVFDSSEQHGKPLEFEAGARQVIAGFDEAVLGMDVEEEKEFSLTPDQAYGEVNEELVQQVPKEQFPQDQELERGMMFMLKLPEGQQVPATVQEVADDAVTLDLNHPLAGKTLHFKIKVVAIES